MYVTTENIKKSHVFSYGHISELYSFVSVCVYVKDTCWKVSVSDKFTIKELLKLTKETTWRQSNIVLKLEKIKFTNTLKKNVQLEDEFKGTKRTKRLQKKKQKTKKTLNIKRLACRNWQKGVDDAARVEKNYSSPTVA